MDRMGGMSRGPAGTRRTPRSGETISGNPRDKRHGTYSGYNYWGCSCDRCRQANRDYMDGRKAEYATREIPDHVHGTHNGYANYGCRCDKCREATNIASRERRAKRKNPEEAIGEPVIQWVDDLPEKEDALKASRKKPGPKPRKKPGPKPKKDAPTRRYPWQEIPEEMREWWISPWAEHGTATGYRYWGCRCDLCKDAQRAESKRLKAKKG